MLDAYKHGPHGCSACHTGCTRVTRSPDQRWQLEATQGYWGSSAPHTLVLGFSMGEKQASRYRQGDFNAAGFAGDEMRSHIRQTLQALGLWDGQQTMAAAVSEAGRGYGFASLARCSFSMRDDKSGNYHTSGPLVPKAPHEAWSRDVMARCISRYLTQMPATVRRVVLFGTTDRYVTGVQAIMRSVFPDYRQVNEVAFTAAGRVWVFVVHPSRPERVAEWLTAAPSTKAGRKRVLAVDAMARFNGPAPAVKPSNIGRKTLVKRDQASRAA